MNNNADTLFKLLVPAIFLILWALNQLFNKEGTPAEAPRAGGGLGPRPTFPPRPTPNYAEAPVAAGYNRPRNDDRRPNERSDNDDILIIDGGSNVPTAVVVPGARPGPGQGRRQGRTRPPKQGGARRTEVTRLTGVGPRPGAPLIAPVSNTSAPVVATTPPVIIEPDGRPRADALLTLMRSPADLRQAIVLSELLGPPRAFRRGRSARRR
jgi:hypothetical protein